MSKQELVPMRTRKSVERIAPKNTYPINTDLAGINPLMDDAKLQGLVLDIQENGQLEPILLWWNKDTTQWEIGDGRNRQNACNKLRIRVKTRKLKKGISYKEALSIVNGHSIRNHYTPTQLAIKAYHFTQRAKDDGRISQEASAKKFGISIRQIKSVASIVKSIKRIVEIKKSVAIVSIYKARHAVGEKSAYTHFSVSEKEISISLLDDLFDGEEISLPTMLSKKGVSYFSSSVDTIAKVIKSLTEINSSPVIEEVHTWNPDSAIKTEAGKKWFKQEIESLGDLSFEVKMHLVELSNFKYPEFLTPLDYIKMYHDSLKKTIVSEEVKVIVNPKRNIEKWVQSFNANDDNAEHMINLHNFKIGTRGDVTYLHIGNFGDTDNNHMRLLCKLTDDEFKEYTDAKWQDMMDEDALDILPLASAA